MLTRFQCKQARELLGWDEWRLAMEAGCSSQTIRNLETWRSQPHASTLSSIRSALEEAGIEFSADPESEVRLRKR